MKTVNNISPCIDPGEYHLESANWTSNSYLLRPTHLLVYLYSPSLSARTLGNCIKGLAKDENSTYYSNLAQRACNVVVEHNQGD